MSSALDVVAALTGEAARSVSVSSVHTNQHFTRQHPNEIMRNHQNDWHAAVTSFTHHLLHTLPTLTVCHSRVTWLCNYDHAPVTLQSSDLLQISPNLIRPRLITAGLWFVHWMPEPRITLMTSCRAVDQWLMCSDQYCYHGPWQVQIFRYMIIV